MNALIHSPSLWGPLAALLVSATLVPPAVAESKVYHETLRSTTWVLSKTDGKTASGTGVLIDAERKLIVTNYHVVREARTAVVFFPAFEGDRLKVDRQYYIENVRKLGIRGRVLAVDRKRDLALIELQHVPEGTKAVPMAPQPVGPGDGVSSIGNAGSSDALWVYTSGTVRAVYRKQFRTGAGEHDFMVVETQSPINSGDSGGPVVNDEGQLVAIAQAISPNARLVSYCVELSEIRAFLASDWKPAPRPLSDVLAAADLKYTEPDKEHVEIQVESEKEKEKKQSVYIERDVDYYERADMRKIYSVALVTKQAPSAETMLKLLQESGRTKIGAWSVEKSPQGEFLVIFSAKIDATATPDTLKSIVEYIGTLTAGMQKQLAESANKPQNAVATLDDWLSGK